MKNWIIIELLKSFTANQQRDFKVFVHIPSLGLVESSGNGYSSLAVKAVELVDAILTNKLSSFDFKLLANGNERQKIKKAIYRFIIFSKATLTNPIVQPFLLEHYLEKGLLKETPKMINIYLDKINRKPRAPDYHQLMYQFYQSQAILKNGRKLLSEPIDKMKEHHILYNLETSMRLICEQCFRNRLPGQSYRLVKDDAIITQKAELSDDFIIQLLYKTYYLIQYPKESDHLFFELVEFLKSQGKKLQRYYRKSIYEYLLNHCIYMVKHDENIDFAAEFLKITQILEDDGLLLNNKEISPQYFKNIVSAFLYFDDFNGLKQFTDKYASKLPKERRKKTAQLAHLHLLFRNELSESPGQKRKINKKAFEDYLKISQLLERTHFPNPVEYTDFRRLELKILYLLLINERCEINVLESADDKFRQYLKRNKGKLHPGMEERCKNFLVCILLLAKQREYPEAPHKRLLDLNEKFYLSDKLWLKSKYKKVTSTPSPIH